MDYLVDRNIDLLEIDTSKEEHVHILVKKGLNVNIKERVINQGIIDIEMEENSVVSYFSTDLGKDTKRTFRLANNSQLDLLVADLTNDNNHRLLDVYLNGEAADANIREIIACKDITSNNEINVYHHAPQTISKVENYLIANEANIKLVVTGKIEKGMAQSNCRQKSRGIVISPKAKIDVLPVLLIDEYDVLANHGASIGKIDEEGLYYLMSRGISKKEAEGLIIQGFLNPIYQTIKDEKERAELVALANQKL